MEKNNTNKFKLLKLPSFFTSSCKTQNLSQVIDHNKNPIFSQSPLSEKIQDNVEEKYPFHKLSIKPKNINNNNNSNSPHYYSSSSLIKSSPLSSSSLMMCKPRCPPASPASALFTKQETKQGNKKKTKKKKINKDNKTIHFRSNYYGIKNGPKSNPFNFSSSNETDDNAVDWFSSDDEREYDDEKQTMFSLKSVSFSSKSISISSDNDSDCPQTQTRSLTQTRASRPRPPRQRRQKAKKVKDTFAVVKSSSDPYNDFRTSMVEMIIEKQIFGAKELKQLLNCFICLNSTHHHKVILEVFNEICDALFSHSS